jgi:EAL domain-containing protein (putative c-di-GMP-specific phosphodiesterase class I)
MDLEDSDDSAAIVAAIIAMSRSLKLRVVAEGVETEGQMRWLAGQGCSLMQGWLFSRAVEAPDFLKLLVRQQRPGDRGLVPPSSLPIIEEPPPLPPLDADTLPDRPPMIEWLAARSV